MSALKAVYLRRNTHGCVHNKMWLHITLSRTANTRSGNGNARLPNLRKRAGGSPKEEHMAQPVYGTPWQTLNQPVRWKACRRPVLARSCLLVRIYLRNPLMRTVSLARTLSIAWLAWEPPQA